jgi:hypothetical protein
MKRLWVIAILLAALLAYGCVEFRDESEIEVEQDGSITILSEPTLFPWELTARKLASNLDAAPGETWEFEFDFDLDLTRWKPEHGRFKRVILGIVGELRHDKAGAYRSGAISYAVSSHLTTTGLPILGFSHWPELKAIHGKNGSPFEAVASFGLPDFTGRHHFEGKLSANLPAETPEGYYEPFIVPFVEVEGMESPVHLEMFSIDVLELPYMALPLVKVGDPAVPRIPWTVDTGHDTTRKCNPVAREEKGAYGFAARSRFDDGCILPPGQYLFAPELPSIFPGRTVSDIAGSVEDFPESLSHYLDFSEGEVSFAIRGPSGEADLRTQRFIGEEDSGPMLETGPFPADLSVPGVYEIKMTGTVSDRFGRRFEGGGTYRIETARKLTFSTSCKPGTSFLVGNRYPPKVNINPPIPAEVEVTVDWYPNSDPSRKQVWTAKGKANRFGHFDPAEAPLLAFEEPGEYRSLVRAIFIDPAGGRWSGEQISTGIVAPVEPEIRLRGVRAYPEGFKADQPWRGGKKRYGMSPHQSFPVMFNKTILPPEPKNPYSPQDTLFFTSTGFNDIDLEMAFSIEVDDQALAQRLLEANRVASLALPRSYQPTEGPWRFYKDVDVRGISRTVTFLESGPTRTEEIPIVGVGANGYHPSFDPKGALIESYAVAGVVRPGFPVFSYVFEKDGIGSYWCTNPNPFGRQINAGNNGDLPGDVYRVQAGVVVKDRESGRNYYDAYGSVLAAIDAETPTASVSQVGQRPMVEENGRKHFLFLASDTHDILLVGERLLLGGMVFPAIEADVRWTVTRPGGEREVITGRSNRLGLVRGKSFIPVDQPGLYRVQAEVFYDGMTGGIVGTENGRFWHAAVDREDRDLLTAEISTGPVDAVRGLSIPVTWPESLTEVKVHLGVIMPGQVLDQIDATPEGNRWEYRFDPFDTAAVFPNFDVIDFGHGFVRMADTVVFLFLLEAMENGEPVFDAVRLVLRGQTLINPLDLAGMPKPTGHGPPMLQRY